MLEDVARIEAAEHELNAFIERRALKMNPEQRRIEDGWAESTRRYNARHREAVLWQKLDFHSRQLEAHTRTYEALIRRHKGAMRLAEAELGIPSEEEGAA